MTDRYPTEPLQLWAKAKELRQRYYLNYARAHETGGIRWGGAGWSFDAIPTAFGDDVYPLTGEPYAASVSHDPRFAKECMDAAETAGFARDLCSYMRIYWGSMLANKYLFGGEFPRPAFNFQTQICCSHAKWYQYASRHEGVPDFYVDVNVGPYRELDASRLDYVAAQLHEAIAFVEWSGRRSAATAASTGSSRRTAAAPARAW